MDDLTPEQLALTEPVVYDDGEIYKKWNRAGGVARFVSIKRMGDTVMLVMDIGEVRNDVFQGHTTCYVSALELVVFLRRRAKDPQFLHFGGAMVEGKPVSRVFKLAPWDNDSPDWAAKCGHFPAKRNNAGGYIPQGMDKPLSAHSIKLSDRELDEIQLRVELALISWAAHDVNFIESVNKRR